MDSVLYIYIYIESEVFDLILGGNEQGCMTLLTVFELCITTNRGIAGRFATNIMVAVWGVRVLSIAISVFWFL